MCFGIKIVFVLALCLALSACTSGNDQASKLDDISVGMHSKEVTRAAGVPNERSHYSSPAPRKNATEEEVYAFVEKTPAYELHYNWGSVVFNAHDKVIAVYGVEQDR